MNAKYIRNIIIIIGIIFIAAVAFGLLQQMKVSKEGVADYLEEMAPVAQAHIKWRQDYNELTELYDTLSLNQKLEQLNLLLNRMEAIRLNVDASAPPGALSYIQSKWNDECFQTTQGIYNITLGLTLNNANYITQGYELLVEADTAHQQWQDELSKILDDNDIELTETVYNSYFSQG